MSHSPYITLHVIAIRQETADTKSLVLRESGENKPVRYQAGQFLTLVFPKTSAEERRSYSMSSAPQLGEPLTITVKRIDNGEFSRLLCDTLAVGDTLLTIGASGFFTLPEKIDQYKTFYFFAGGSGIAPIFSMIKTILHAAPNATVRLWYSNKSPESTIFLEELEHLQERYASRMEVEFLFSSSKNLLRARMSKLRVADILKDLDQTEKEKTLFYLCGPFNYMQMIAITLLTEGVPQENIRKENFSTTKPLVKELPPDQDQHQVTIYYENSAHVLNVKYPLTILETAKRAGIPLPYSCEAGKCGTCAATCIEGNVWMSYNEVLLEKETAQGRVLTCVGYPFGGDVQLEFPAPA